LAPVAVASVASASSLLIWNLLAIRLAIGLAVARASPGRILMSTPRFLTVNSEASAESSCRASEMRPARASEDSGDEPLRLRFLARSAAGVEAEVAGAPSEVVVTLRGWLSGVWNSSSSGGRLDGFHPGSGAVA